MGIFDQTKETLYRFFFGAAETLPSWGNSFLDLLSVGFIVFMLFLITGLLIRTVRALFKL